MIPARKFRHYATIGGMEIHLAVERISDESAFRIKEREPGLIAGAFDAKHAHERNHQPKKAAC